jgi:conserved hypothetical integral membrane protein TIGR02206
VTAIFNTTKPVGLFSPEHLIILAGAAFFCAVMIGIGGRLGEKGKKHLLITLWAVFTVIELCKYIHFALYPDQFNVKTGLPFHLCSISLFTYPLAVFTQNRIFRNFIYAVNMPGALFALITPDIGNSSMLSFYFMHLIIAHTFIVLIPLYMVCCGFFRPDYRLLPGVTLMFLATMIPALLLNRFTGSNYYFINGPVDGTLTGQFAQWTGDDAYLLPMLGLLIAVWALLYAPYAAADLIRKRRE